MAARHEPMSDGQAFVKLMGRCGLTPGALRRVLRHYGGEPVTAWTMSRWRREGPPMAVVAFLRLWHETKVRAPRGARND